MSKPLPEELLEPEIVRFRTESERELYETAMRELRVCSEALGHSPSMREYAAYDETTVHPQRIAKLFGKGGWNAAKREAGLGVRRHATDEELFEHLIRMNTSLRRLPTSRDINADETAPSASLYLQRFGSLPDALRLAGLAPVGDELIGRILALGLSMRDMLERFPNWADWVAMRKQYPDIPSEWQVYRRFGGGEGAWRLFTYYLMEAESEVTV